MQSTAQTIAVTEGLKKSGEGLGDKRIPCNNKHDNIQYVVKTLTQF